MFIKFGLGIFGEELLLKGLRAQSDKLTGAGFTFQHSSVTTAIQYALKKPKGHLAYLDITSSTYSKMTAIAEFDATLRRVETPSEQLKADPLHLKSSGNVLHRRPIPLVSSEKNVQPPASDMQIPIYSKL